MSKGEILYADDADTIGMKIVEMADRVKTVHAVMPGAQAAWVFEMDDVLYRVVVTVDTSKPKAEAGS